MRNEILNGAKTRAKVPRTNQGQSHDNLKKAGHSH